MNEQKLEKRLEIKNLTFSYPDKKKAVENISFDISDGESVGIIGANGAGKSTLLMLIMGILFPSAGEIMVCGVPVVKKTLPVIRQKLGMVFQNPDDQLFMTTVYDDVAFGPRNYKLDESEVQSRVEKALGLVGASSLKDKSPLKLSGGEKKAVSIATVLSMEPEVLIMDEPTAALDPRSRRRVIKLLNEFNHTKIITSHDMDMILETCSRVIIVKEGRIISDGGVTEILTNSKLLEECGLEVPLSMQNCPVCTSIR